MRLSAHFSLFEMTRSQLAARHRLENRPDSVAIDNLMALCREVMEPLRAHFACPIHPTSGYRGRAVNRLLGSSDNSQHCRGEAVDFEIAGIANIDIARHIETHLCFDQLILEYPQIGQPNAGWIHISYSRGANRQSVLTRLANGYKQGLPSFPNGAEEG